MGAHSFSKRLSRLTAAAMLAVLVCLSGISAHAAGYSVDPSTGKIYGPDNKEFIAKEANVFPGEEGMASQVIDCWKFNMVRLDFVPGVFNTAQLENAVNVFTSRNIPTIVDYHLVGGFGEGQQSAITSFLTTYANKYKNNPYVWLEIYNEPGYVNSVTTSGVVQFSQNDVNTWTNLMRTNIQAIRSTGFTNPILVGALFWGQDILEDSGYNPQFNLPFSQSSSIAKYGPTIQNGFSNIVFDVHVYNEFSHGGDFTSYITTLQNAKLAFIIGEYGTGNANDPTIVGTRKVFATLNAGKNFGVGVWHFSSLDGNDLTTAPNGGNGDQINSCTSPTNLSEMGQLTWNNNHKTYTGGTLPTPAPTPTPVATNPSPTPAPVPAPAPIPVTPPASTAMNVTYQAENMTKAAMGAVSGAYYSLWTNGYIEQAGINFPTTGSYNFAVKAYANVAGGVGAAMEVRIDGVKIASMAVTSLNTYTATANVTAGTHKVEIAFINDGFVNGQDRNLWVDSLMITSSAAPVVSKLNVTYQAETMTKAAMGAVSGAYYSLWTNGYIEQTGVSFPSTGAYTFDVLAYANVAGGVGAAMELRVDGVKIASTTVTSLAHYVLTAKVAAGTHKVEIAFINDGFVNGQDRNLWIDNLTIHN